MVQALPSLNALRAFEAVARHGRLVDAAAELGVTHGAVSRQIGQLERHLDVRLFRRESNRLRLTEPGAQLARTLTSAFDLIRSGVDQLRRRDGVRLNVSCLGTFAMRWLIPRLFRFQSRYPDLDVRLSTSDAPVDFDTDDIDLAIRIGAPPWPTGIDADVLFSEEAGPVLSPELQETLDLREPDDLARAPLLHTQTRTAAWADWARRIGVAGLAVEQGQMFEHLYFMLQAAASGLGVAIGPWPLVADDIAAGRLVAPFGFRPSGLDYVVLRAPRRGRRADAFAAWLLAEAGEERA
jgi:DNA-binding transcriptional LysR family regulator